MDPIRFIPLMITTLALAYASFKTTKKNKSWLIVAFIIWLLIFLLTMGVLAK